MKSYIIASTKPWNIHAFAARRTQLPGRWFVITDPHDLTIDLVRTTVPRYIFFMHWSTIVPMEILDAAECVCFHETDLPYGRGGSPIQNLIAQGHKETKLSAFRMTEKLDAGPIYGKLPLSLRGSASEIFLRCANLSLDLIEQVTRHEPVPIEQRGEPVFFRRRVPKQSVLPDSGGLPALYDHIRMLDAETYPHAFIDYGRFRIEFSNARLDANGTGVTADARVVALPDVAGESADE